MRPVGVIHSKVHPGGEDTILRNARNIQADVLCKIFPLVLQNTALFALVFAPGRKELGGTLILAVTNNFPDEGEFTLRDLVPDGWDFEKSHPEGGVRRYRY